MRTLLFALALTVSTATFAGDSSSLIPLNDLGTAPYRFGYFGGLYENGSNVMAADHFAIGLAAASRIQPLDADGRPSSAGKVVFLAVGFGETARIMQSFMSIAADDVRVERGNLVMLNAARDGADYRFWAERPDGMPRYGMVQSDTLAPAGVTPQQVQVAWVGIINGPAFIPLGSADADPYYLKAYIAETLREMKRQYPNLQIAYLSSRVYGGYSVTNFTPEPFSFETGYANRWIITNQMEQERMDVPEWYWDTRAGLVDDTRRAVVPWVAWGPYLWANGATPRADGLAWLRGDFEADGETLSPSGAIKGAKMLFDFLLHEPTAKGWFLSGIELPARQRAASH
jgi:hypothetical protein